MRHFQMFVPFVITALFLVGCQEQEPPSAGKTIPAETQTSSTEQAPAKTETSLLPPKEDRTPPTPPLKEDFQGEPRMSLFPRVGNFQPPIDDEAHSYWRTFIEHLVKITRVVENKGDGNRGWVFRSIESIDSVGYFAPVAVEPETDYHVTFEMTADLPEGASAGVGILEFDEFLWIGEQYSEEIYQKHSQGFQEGLRFAGTVGGLQTFTFRTGPNTRMVHMVLFREGPHDRSSSLIFDNLEIR